MRELVKLAESREAAAKSEIGKLLDSRASMFEKAEGQRELDGVSDEQRTHIEDAERRMDQASRAASIQVTPAQASCCACLLLG